MTVAPIAEAPDDYRAFLEKKSQIGEDSGFDPVWMPDFLYPFQQALVEFALRKGRGAIFAACGLGKTPQQLVWAENVVRKTNGRVLILTPLSVSAQTIREAEKFGIEAKRSNDGTAHSGITVTNYEKLDKFSEDDFAGVVCDESGVLKHAESVRREAVTHFMRKRPHRLLCSATPSPNDYIELGNSSEALGQLGYMDMLSKFFKNDQNSNHPNRLWAGGAKWRFRGHAERDFWRWVCSWARAIQKPSDMGFDDGPFILPPLTMNEHVVHTAVARPGMLFAAAAVTLQEQRQERRLTLTERCERAAALVDDGAQAIAWAHLNDEGDLLERLISGSVQVSGSDSDEEKEEAFLAFADGQARVLVSKPTVAGFGLNFQNCAHQTFFPSHSMEQFHQCVRRSWRFGQKLPVHVDIVTSDGEIGVLKNLKRKTEAMDVMFQRLVAVMNEELNLQRTTPFTKAEELPSWL
jgi:hypothetical protein